MDGNGDDHMVDEENEPQEDAKCSNEIPTGNSFSTSKSENETPKTRNLNSYYGHKVGFLQTLSLVLNAGLMVYAHFGLSAVILSSQDPSITSAPSTNLDDNNSSPLVDDNSTSSFSVGKCNEQDVALWIEYGGEATRPIHSNYCSRTYNGGCLVTNACIEQCFQEVYFYSANCSTCFGAIPECSMRESCTWKCASDSFSPDCQQCNIPCIEKFDICTGFPKGVEAENETIPIAPELGNGTNSVPSAGTIEYSCNNFDLEAIDEWYNVYNLTFVRSVNDAWHGDAKLLAVIVVLFSGIWPYAKNIILIIVWYYPMSVKSQDKWLLWLSRLSKYTLVDVFAVIAVLVGVQLQLNIGGTESVIRGEPRAGIIAFFLATIWEFLQIELVKSMFVKKVLGGHSQEEGKLLFSQLWIPVAFLLVSVCLYIAGGVTEIVHFTSSDSSGVCERSYNLATLGNALVNDQSMIDNSASGQTWILYLVYVLLNLALPVLTHLLQIIFIFGWSRSKILERMIYWTAAIWCFACVDVLLIGIFAVEFKFEKLIMKIAGSNADFLRITSGLGPGFFVLIAYSVVAGFLQFALKIQRDDGTKSLNESVDGDKKEVNGV